MTERLRRYRSAQRKGAWVGVACWVVASYDRDAAV